MSRLKDLSTDKITVMQRILNSQGICKSLFYSDSNFLDKPDLTDDQKMSLLYSKIYPYKKIPDPESTASSYIALSFQGYKPVKLAYKSGLIHINVLIHKDFMETDYGILRSDYIVSEIDELMNQQLGIGIGKAEFFAMDDIIVNDKYLGSTIVYKIYEFN